ncbi:MAG: glycine cleavage system protein GcvH [Chloroflexi bacterium]|nr:glycine cleavage system protein GcvH [Chloroflexota bacterium]
MNPPELRYSREHEWVRMEKDGTATIGITHYAQEQLGDVVYVDLPEKGKGLSQFTKFGEIESVKAVSDLFAPIGGEIIATNAALKDSPELVNTDPYGQGWMVKVKPRDTGELKSLMDSKAYDLLLQETT